MDLSAFTAAGHHDPAAPGAVQRAALIEHLVERFGISEVLAAAGRVPMFSVAVELSDPPAPRISARAVAERAGTPLETVVRMRSALGFPVTDPEAATIPDTFVDDLTIAQAALETFGHERTFAFVRVLGAAMQQLAEAGRALFASAVVDDGGQDAASELALSEQNELAWLAWRSLPSVLEHTMLELGDASQELVHEILAGEVARAIGFVDLVGSTAWTEQSDPLTQTAALVRFEQGAWEAATRHGGRVVKLIGDEAMFVASDTVTACRIAATLIEFVRSDPELPPARAGIAYGDVVARAGDYFGPTVNLAARALGVAAAEGIAVPSSLLSGVAKAEFAVEDLGLVALRGIAAPVQFSGLR